MSDIVQRLATGKLTDLESRGYSEESLKLINEDDSPEPRKVSFSLNPIERAAIYQDVKHRVINGMTPDDIGRSVVACIDEILKEKEDQAYGSVNTKMNGDLKKGGFRRVE